MEICLQFHTYIMSMDLTCQYSFSKCHRNRSPRMICTVSSYRGLLQVTTCGSHCTWFLDSCMLFRYWMPSAVHCCWTSPETTLVSLLIHVLSIQVNASCSFRMFLSKEITINQRRLVWIIHVQPDLKHGSFLSCRTASMENTESYWEIIVSAASAVQS
jgi:hypothetical protein